jgi:hypothetical protein
VVLTPEEWRVRRPTGETPRIGFPIFDPAGRRCRITFDACYDGGGVIEMTKVDGKWNVTRQEGEGQRGGWRRSRRNSIEEIDFVPFMPEPEEGDFEE